MADMTTDEDVARIAKGLSKAQQKALLESGEVRSDGAMFWCNDWRTAKSIARKGLIEGLDYKCCGPFTLLGLRVRDHLKGKSNG